MLTPPPLGNPGSAIAEDIYIYILCRGCLNIVLSTEVDLDHCPAHFPVADLGGAEGAIPPPQPCRNKS